MLGEPRTGLGLSLQTPKPSTMVWRQGNPAQFGLCHWESLLHYQHRLKRPSLLQRLLPCTQPLCFFPGIIVLSPIFVTSLRQQMKLQNLGLSFNFNQAFDWCSKASGNLWCRYSSVTPMQGITLCALPALRVPRKELPDPAGGSNKFFSCFG